MSTARTTAFVGLLAALSACAREPGPGAPGSGAPGSGAPNVLLVSIDMLRPDHLGCYGYARDTSPAIDRLAAEGALYEQHVSSTSWTLPAHAALFTSLPDSVHGATDADRRLADERTTLAERFAAAGYRTAGFFSGPFLHPAFGLGQGFETYQNCTSYAALLDASPTAAEIERSSHEDVTNPTVYAAFERWLDARDASRPFFAFLHLWDVHFDFRPPPPWDAKFDPGYEGPVTGAGFFHDPSIRADMPLRDLEHLLALYDGEIGWTDTWIARIRAELERRGLFEDTIVVVTSDHGTEFFEHGYKGHRMTLYDEVLRIPLVIRFPRSVPRGVRVAAQTRMVDVGPTLLELAGLPPAPDVAGTSLAALARDPRAPHPPRALAELSSVGRDLVAVRARGWKLVNDLAREASAYFDLGADPRELRPLEDPASALGREAAAGYLAEVEALAALRARHPELDSGADVPADVLEQMRRFGYTGDEPPGGEAGDRSRGAGTPPGAGVPPDAGGMPPREDPRAPSPDAAPSSPPGAPPR